MDVRLMSQVRILRIVVASPSDVQAERDALPAVIKKLNKRIAAERGLRLEISRWEEDAYAGFHIDGPQGLIDAVLRIEECDIFIGIFWKRFGTPTKEARSGTEHEFKLAYEAWKKKGSPQIMIYFNQKPYTPKSKAETDQWGHVLEFKENFSEEGLWWSFKGKAQFADLVYDHLENYIYICNKFPIPSQPKPISTERLQEMLDVYRSHLAGKVSMVRIFGEAESRPLENVFVELTVVEEYQRPTIHAEWLGLMDAELRRRRDPFARETEGSDAGAPDRSRDKVKRTVKPDEFLRGPTQAVVVGAPGCGKTTLLRYLALKTLEEGNRFPVFLELKSVSPKAFHDAGEDLAALLFEKAIAEPLHLSPAERETFKEYFIARLAAGEARLFLDGLDEVRGAELFPNLCRAVNQWTGSTYRQNDLVISTRPYALQTRFEGLKEMEIAPLSPTQINEFLDHYYAEDPRIKTLAQLLRHRRELREMARVPFLLGVIAYLYRRQGDIVGERLELYRQIVHQLVVQLDSEKGIERFHIKDPRGSRRLRFLKQLAYERLFVDEVEQEANRLVFTGEDIVRKAQSFCQPGIDADLFAADVIATPLLREVGADAYAFAHLTIQEYLAATALAEQNECEKIFCRAYFNPTLAEMEVLSMTLGLVRNPDDLYTALEQLPESLNFTNLRLRARGLVYAQKINQEHLTKLTDRLIEFVLDRNPDETGYTNPVLGSFSVAGGPSLKFIVDRLSSLLKKDEDSFVRGSAAWALGQIGSAEAVQALLKALNAKDRFVWGNTAEALGQIGGAEAVQALLKALNAKDRFVWGNTAEALGQIGGAEAVQALLKALRGGGRGVRGSAAAALRQIGSAEAVPALLPALRGGDRGVRGSAAAALGQIGSAEAVPALLPALNDEDRGVRWSAAAALGQIGSAEAVPALLPALNDEDSGVRESVAAALGKIEDEALAHGLLRALAHKEVFVRRKAAQVIGYYTSDNHALEALQKLATTDPDDEVRRAAGDALDKFRRKLQYVCE
jgi:HEAT repeat protein